MPKYIDLTLWLRKDIRAINVLKNLLLAVLYNIIMHYTFNVCIILINRTNHSICTQTLSNIVQVLIYAFLTYRDLLIPYIWTSYCHIWLLRKTGIGFSYLVFTCTSWTSVYEVVTFCSTAQHSKVFSKQVIHYSTYKILMCFFKSFSNLKSFSLTKKNHMSLSSAIA